MRISEGQELLNDLLVNANEQAGCCYKGFEWDANLNIEQSWTLACR